MPDIPFKYYVSEKETMGVIWSVFYDADKSIHAEVAHNKIEGKRPESYLYMHKDFSGSRTTTIANLKTLTNNGIQVIYELLTTNCHLYIVTVLVYLEMSLDLPELYWGGTNPLLYSTHG